MAVSKRAMNVVTDGGAAKVALPQMRQVKTHTTQNTPRTLKPKTKKQNTQSVRQKRNARCVSLLPWDSQFPLPGRYTRIA